MRATAYQPLLPFFRLATSREPGMLEEAVRAVIGQKRKTTADLVLKPKDTKDIKELLASLENILPKGAGLQQAPSAAVLQGTGLPTDIAAGPALVNFILKAQKKHGSDIDIRQLLKFSTSKEGKAALDEIQKNFIHQGVVPPKKGSVPPALREARERSPLRAQLGGFNPQAQDLFQASKQRGPKVGEGARQRQEISSVTLPDPEAPSLTTKRKQGHPILTLSALLSPQLAGRQVAFDIDLLARFVHHADPKTAKQVVGQISKELNSAEPELLPLFMNRMLAHSGMAAPSRTVGAGSELAERGIAEAMGMKVARERAGRGLNLRDFDKGEFEPSPFEKIDKGPLTKTQEGLIQEENLGVGDLADPIRQRVMGEASDVPLPFQQAMKVAMEAPLQRRSSKFLDVVLGRALEEGAVTVDLDPKALSQLSSDMKKYVTTKPGKGTLTLPIADLASKVAYKQGSIPTFSGVHSAKLLSQVPGFSKALGLARDLPAGPTWRVPRERAGGMRPFFGSPEFEKLNPLQRMEAISKRRLSIAAESGEVAKYNPLEFLDHDVMEKVLRKGYLY
tara:strand:+ start:669 stop:2357 length:1689 start_codon:yes stop_codon:yes gene_type:complete